MTDHQPPTVDRGVVVPRSETMSVDDFDAFVEHLTDTVRLGFPTDRPANDFDIEECVRSVLVEAGFSQAFEVDPTLPPSMGGLGQTDDRVPIDAVPAQSPAALDEAVGLLREALEPFARFLDVLETMGGTTPREGPYCEIQSASKGEAVITIEDFKAARAARAFLANLEPSQ